MACYHDQLVQKLIFSKNGRDMKSPLSSNNGRRHFYALLTYGFIYFGVEGFGVNKLYLSLIVLAKVH